MIAEEQKLYRFLLGMALICALFIAYGSLLPFDFQPRTIEEIRQTIVNADRANGFISLTDRLVNILIAIPFGFFAFGALARPHSFGRNLIAVIAIVAFSLFLGAAVEFLQLYLPTRSASYGDIIAQGLGACLGIIFWKFFGRPAVKIVGRLLTAQPPDRTQVRPLMALFATIGVLPYLILLLAVNGWFYGGWIGVNEAANKIGELHFAPLYYHYYANIFRSVYSVAVVLIEYAPIGVLCWFGLRSHSSIFRVAIIGTFAGLTIESSKLFLIGRHPDSTNVLLAGFASAISYALLSRFVSAARRDPDPPSAAMTAETFRHASAVEVSPLRKIGLRAISVGILGITLVAVLNYPLGGVWLGFAILLFSGAALRFPALWLIVIPALLPSFDLAPWTGWFFLSEFDLFLLATIAVGLWLSAGRNPGVRIPRSLGWLLLAYGLSSGVSFFLGLWPLEPLDANAFSNYYSHYNALRAAKGFVLAIGLIPLLLVNLDQGIDVLRRLSVGMVVGLLTMIAATLWERAVFPGLLNFSSDYRISALFSTMHTGGSNPEAYLITALPFTLTWASNKKSFAFASITLVLLSLGAYALFVTFSRGGYFAFAVSVVAFALSSAMACANSPAVTLKKFGSVLLVLISLGVIAASCNSKESFANKRLAQTESDLNSRFTHWRNVLHMMDSGWQAGLFGMGLGRYPRTYFFRYAAAEKPTTYGYVTEGKNTFLRLGRGETGYIEQILTVKPHSDYKLAFDIKPAASVGILNVMLCERTFFKSFNCRDSGLWKVGQENVWSHHEATIDSGPLGTGPWFARRPVKLVLENTVIGSVIDVDNIHLVGSNGVDLVANGDFSQGSARWYFTPFNHWPWHVDNIAVQLIFEQGWIGFLTFLFLLAYCLNAIVGAVRQGSIGHAAILTSLCGFLAVGLFGSPFDTPRLGFLFYFLTLGGVLSGQLPQARNERATDRGFDSTAAKTFGEGPVDPKRLARPEAAFEAPHSLGSAAPTAAVNAFNENRSEAAASVWDPSGLERLAFQVIGGMCIFVAAAWLVMHSPFVPYNVRDLLHPVHPILSLIVFAAFLYWSIGLPVLVGLLMTQSNAATWSYPMLVAIHSTVAWFALTYSVSFDRIHKIVGSPVLHFHWYWEPAGRFIALFGAFSLSMTASALLVIAFLYKRRSVAAVLSWLFTTVALSSFLYWVVVTKAATDNLIELMAGGGSPLAAFFLSCFVILIFFGGSSLAAQLQRIGSGIRIAVLFALLISIPLAYLSFVLGSESTLEKYGKTFSALQFLLSPDREHYVQGLALGFRYLVFHLALIGGIAFVQYPIFSWLFPVRGRRRKAD